MKAERRHELQTNTLALWLRWRAPELAQKYGTHALLAVIVLALAVVLIRWRIEAPKKAAQQAANRLADARVLIGDLQAGKILPSDAAQATKLINDALEQSDTPAVHGQGYLALGNYYWALVNWPDLPAAATQPTLRPEQPRETLLNEAEKAYTKVLSVQDVPAYLAASARIGLGVINEQRAFDLSRANKDATEKWNAAKEQYEAAEKINGVPPVLKDEARWHVERLATVQQPIWLVTPSELPPTTQATQPATTRPATTQPK